MTVQLPSMESLSRLTLELLLRDRLGRALEEIIVILKSLEVCGARSFNLTERVDTTTPRRCCR